MLEQIQNKISTLTKAINSPVTPNGTRELMKQQVAKLEAQFLAINTAKEIAEQITGFLDAIINQAYVLKDTKGYAEKTTSLSEDGTEITITVKGESPIADKDDEKSITNAVLDFKGTTHEIKLESPYHPYTGTATVDIASVKINEEQVTGKIFLIMNPSLNG